MMQYMNDSEKSSFCIRALDQSLIHLRNAQALSILGDSDDELARIISTIKEIKINESRCQNA